MPIIPTLGERLRYSWIRPIYDSFNIMRWNMRGRPIPPPYGLKRRTVMDYARSFKIKVDTEHHLIVTHEVTNVGTDRSQLAHMATARVFVRQAA